MSTPTAKELTQRTCVPCEGGVPKLSGEQAREMLKGLPGWELSEGAHRIRRKWVVRNFKSGVDFFIAIMDVAERENHHPDLHLEGYRNVTVEIWTHAIGGLSENDFILAAKIGELPVAIR